MPASVVGRSAGTLDIRMNNSHRIDEGRVLSESEVAGLLERLCVQLGFCFSADVAENFESHPPGTIEAFTRAVFDDEGLAIEPGLYTQVRAVVETTFNGTT
jgi:hypothetical protein